MSITLEEEVIPRVFITSSPSIFTLLKSLTLSLPSHNNTCIYSSSSPPPPCAAPCCQLFPPLGFLLASPFVVFTLSPSKLTLQLVQFPRGFPVTSKSHVYSLRSALLSVTAHNSSLILRRLSLSLSVPLLLEKKGSVHTSVGTRDN